MLLKPVKVMIPEPLVLRDPLPNRSETRGDEAVATLSAMSLFCHETGIEQNTKMLRDGRSAHLKLRRDRVDGTVGFNKEIKHPAARGVTNRPKHIRLAIGSRQHASNIRK